MDKPWFPDYVAKWYDEFCAGSPYPDLDRWDLGGIPIMNTWKRLLKNNPHDAAVKIDESIRSSGGIHSEEEKRFYGLKVASGMFQAMGFRIPKQAVSAEWKSIRHHWVKCGNLLRDGIGYLLPREPPPYEWSWIFEPLPHTEESWFDGFVRWRPSDHPNLKIRSTVLPVTSSPPISQRLRIGIVPLVASVADFHVYKDDSDRHYPRFSVSLKDPDEVGRAALRALESSAREECDIVVFPELCLTPLIQDRLRERLLALGNHPWLVVAGSARTPVLDGAVTAHYNQTLVFESQGKLMLSHHKLHRYLMDVSQQERYGMLETLGEVDRLEDMEIAPFEVEILDTAAGRLAVLICEDLSVTKFVEPLVVKLGLDWLFVPVMDGCQMPNRWPARFGQTYAARGVGVVVATSLSLVAQHILRLEPAPAAGVGLILVPSSSGVKIRILESLQHDQPAIFDLKAGTP